MAGVIVLWLLASSRLVDRFLQRAISRALERLTDLDTRDYASLLRLSDDFTVAELEVQEGGWLEGSQLDDMRLPDEGVTVLGVYRKDGSYLAAPRGSAKLHAGDTVILYGHAETVGELDSRRAGAAGEEAHHRAVERQRERDARQEREERERERKSEEG